MYSLKKSFYYVSPSKQAYYSHLALISDDLPLLIEEVVVLYCLENYDLVSIAGYHPHYSVKIALITVYLLHYYRVIPSLEDCVLNWVDNDRN